MPGGTIFYIKDTGGSIIEDLSSLVGNAAIFYSHRTYKNNNGTWILKQADNYGSITGYAQRKPCPTFTSSNFVDMPTCQQIIGSYNSFSTRIIGSANNLQSLTTFYITGGTSFISGVDGAIGCVMGSDSVYIPINFGATQSATACDLYISKIFSNGVIQLINNTSGFFNSATYNNCQITVTVFHS
jgi:hypothetical protein